jgi:protein tyrosine/serine phosphatase
MSKRFSTDTFGSKLWAYFYANIVEHPIINEIRPNFHQISDDMYRSSQPTTRQLKKMIKKYNLKTIISLRGDNENSALQMIEKEICEQMGVEFKVVRLYSRDVPKVEELELIKELCTNSTYPMMFHCKAGADRAGLFATMYLYFIKNIPLKDAIVQMRFIPYGHFKYSNSGRIDYFFDKYLESGSNLDIIEWAKTQDRDKIRDEFRPEPLFNFINDYIFKRE